MIASSLVAGSRADATAADRVDAVAGHAASAAAVSRTCRARPARLEIRGAVEAAALAAAATAARPPPAPAPCAPPDSPPPRCGAACASACAFTHAGSGVVPLHASFLTGGGGGGFGGAVGAAAAAAGGVRPAHRLPQPAARRASAPAVRLTRTPPRAGAFGSGGGGFSMRSSCSVVYRTRARRRERRRTSGATAAITHLPFSLPPAYFALIAFFRHVGRDVDDFAADQPVRAGVHAVGVP